ncbi:hypothetical protein ACKKBG_A00095 [Auxenochlorella protothecoides x Auxenochlorella symbiontica]
MSGLARDRFPAAISAGLLSCSKEAAVYGGCIKTLLPEVERGVCDREFQILKSCMRAALRHALAKSS